MRTARNRKIVAVAYAAMEEGFHASERRMRGDRALFLALGLLAACGSPEPAANESAAGANAAASRTGPPAASGGRAEAGAVIPAEFGGVYDSSREACGRPSEYRLTVTGRELRFHESIGVVREVVAEGADTVRVEADYQGEGESWRAAHHLRLADGGATLTITGQGTNLTRIRCTAAEPAGAAATASWQAGVRGEDAALFLAVPGGRRRLSLLCPAESGDLVVNVPAFRAVGSEERMSFGAGGIAVTLVADARGDERRGGVTGRGPVPAELAAILAAADGVAVSYGAQDSGPHDPPPAELARNFIAGCRG